MFPDIMQQFFNIIEQFPTEFPILKTSISAVIAFVLGVVWYNPVVMGKTASAAMSEEIKGYKPGVSVYLLVMCLWFVSSCVYTFLTGFLTPPTFAELLGLSTFLWVGFALPATLLSGLFAGKKLMVMGVDSSYYLAALYLFAVIHNAF